MDEFALCDHLYAGPSLNALLAALLPEELGAPPLHEIDCNGFLSREDLARLVRVLDDQWSAGEPHPRRVLDLGCGSGGLARYLAGRLGCVTMGVDRSARAIARALAARPIGPVGELEFRIGGFEATGLAEGSIGAVVSLDALYLATSPAAALVEAHRVLSTAGALIFTTYSTLGDGHFRWVEWCALARSIGFTVTACRDLTRPWRSLMRRKHEARWNSQNEVHRVLGDRATAELQVSAAMLGVGGASFIDATERHEIELRRG